MACPIHVFSDEGELWLCDLSAAGRAMVSLPRPQAEDLAWLSDLSAEGRKMVGEEAIAKDLSLDLWRKVQETAGTTTTTAE